MVRQLLMHSWRGGFSTANLLKSWAVALALATGFQGAQGAGEAAAGGGGSSSPGPSAVFQGGEAQAAASSLHTSPQEVWQGFWRLLAGRDCPSEDLKPRQSLEKSASFLSYLLLRPQIELTEAVALPNLHRQEFAGLMSSLWRKNPIYSPASPEMPPTAHYLGGYLEALRLDVVGENPLNLPEDVIETPVVALLMSWLKTAEGVLTPGQILHLKNQMERIWDQLKEGRLTYAQTADILYPLEHRYTRENPEGERSLEDWVSSAKLWKTRLPGGEFIFKALRRAVTSGPERELEAGGEGAQDLVESWLKTIDILTLSPRVQERLIRGMADYVGSWPEDRINHALRQWHKSWQSPTCAREIDRLNMEASGSLVTLLISWQSLLPARELRRAPSSGADSRDLWDLLDVYREARGASSSDASKTSYLSSLARNLGDPSREIKQLRSLPSQIDTFLSRGLPLNEPLGEEWGTDSFIDVLLDKLKVDESSREIQTWVAESMSKILAHDERQDMGRHISPSRLRRLYQFLSSFPEGEGPAFAAPLRERLKDLAKDHPGWDLALRLYEVLGNIRRGGAGGGAGDYRIQVPGGGYFELSGELRSQLFDGAGRFKAINRDATGAGDVGRREVGRMSKDGLSLCVKRLPELPGLEVAVSAFMNQLLGRGGVPSLLVRYGSEPWLITPFMPQMLDRHLDLLPSVQVDEGIILALLTNPEDGNRHNYAIQTSRSGARYIVGIDNDHSLGPTVAKAYKDGSTTFTPHVKSVLFCLDQMKAPLSEPLMGRLRDINPEGFLTAWLERLKPLETAYDRLFAEEEKTTLWEEHKIFTGFVIRQDMIRRIFEKFSTLLQVLNPRVSTGAGEASPAAAAAAAASSSPVPSPSVSTGALPGSYLELIFKVDPALWKVYAGVLGDKPEKKAGSEVETVQERFRGLHGASYITRGDRLTTRTTTEGYLAVLLDQADTSDETLSKALGDHRWGVEEALGYLKAATEGRAAREMGKSGAAFRALRTNEEKYSFLKHLPWGTLSGAEQTFWLDLIQEGLQREEWRRLLCPPTPLMTLERFNTWRMDNVQDLVLDGCLRGAPESLAILAAGAPGLTRLSLRNLDWPVLGIPQRVLFIHLPSREIGFEYLDELNIENCPQLSFIKMNAPALKRVHINQAKALTFEGLVRLTRKAPKLLIHPGDIKETGLGEEDRLLLTYDPRFPWERLSKAHREEALREARGVPATYWTAAPTYSPLAKAIVKSLSARSWDIAVLRKREYLPHLSLVLGHLTDLQTLYLAGNFLGADGAARMKALAPVLGHLTDLQTLYLARNFLGADGAARMKALSPVLGHLTGLQSLNLRFNDLGDDGAAGMKALSPVLGHLTGLRKLDLEDNGLGAAGAAALAPALGHLTGLQSLNLRLNHLGAAAAAALAPVLGHLTGLQSLNLGGNRLGLDGAAGMKALSPVLGHLTGLQSLDLSGNPCGGAEVAAALAPVLGHLTGLQSLNLSWNDLGAAEAAAALAPVLTRLTGLQKLYLRGNHLGLDGAAGMKALSPALGHLTGLQYLDLGRNELDAKGAAALAPVLTRLTGLQWLNLEDNKLFVDGEVVIKASFMDHPAIERIEGLGYDSTLSSLFARNKSAREARKGASESSYSRSTPKPAEPSYALTFPDPTTYPRSSSFELGEEGLPLFLDQPWALGSLKLEDNPSRRFSEGTTLYTTGPMGLFLAGLYLRDGYTGSFVYGLENLQAWLSRGTLTGRELRSHFGQARLSDLFHEETPGLVFAAAGRLTWSLEKALETYGDDIPAQDPLLTDMIIRLLTSRPVAPEDLGVEGVVVLPLSEEMPKIQRSHRGEDEEDEFPSAAAAAAAAAGARPPAGYARTAAGGAGGDED